MATTEYTVTNTAWTQVSTGATNVFLTTSSPGPLLVHVGTSAPALSAPGHPVRPDAKTGWFSLMGVVGQNVYLRSGDPNGLAIPTQVTAV